MTNLFALIQADMDKAYRQWEEHIMSKEHEGFKFLQAENEGAGKPFVTKQVKHVIDPTLFDKLRWGGEGLIPKREGLLHPQNEFEAEIVKACDLLKVTLLKKNRDYKNSYVSTVEKFGKATPLIRFHDKTSRLENLIMGNEQFVEGESIADNLMDLAGYSILEYARMQKAINNKEKIY